MHVKLSIKKIIHQDYLNFLFERNENGEFMVSRNQDFGKLIVSLVKYSNIPIKYEGLNLVDMILPRSSPLTNAANYHCFITVEDQEKLNDGLDVLFNIDFDSYYLQGRKLKMQQKDIIQSFILNRALTKYIGDNETLKKRQYRDELKMQKKYAEYLRQAAYQRHERIDLSLKNYNQLTTNCLH